MITALRRKEALVLGWLSRYGHDIMRVGLGIVFLWFGALKFVPGLSPAEGLIARTVDWAIDPALFQPLLAAWECAIGIGLLFNRPRRATLILMFAHMGGTFMPLVVCPELVWAQFPWGFTLEGQYILKNFVLIGAGLVLLGRLASHADAASWHVYSGSHGLDRLRARHAKAARPRGARLHTGFPTARLSG